MTSAVVFQIQSFCVYALMVFGITKRKKRKIHVPTMITVLVWDIILILQIEKISNEIHDTTLSLPISFFHSEQDVENVCSEIFNFFKQYP